MWFQWFPRQQLQEGGRHSSTCKREAVTHWPQLLWSEERERLRKTKHTRTPQAGRRKLKSFSGRSMDSCHGVWTCDSLNLSHCLKIRGKVWIKYSGIERMHADRRASHCLCSTVVIAVVVPGCLFYLIFYCIVVVDVVAAVAVAAVVDVAAVAVVAAVAAVAAAAVAAAGVVVVAVAVVVVAVAVAVAVVVDVVVVVVVVVLSSCVLFWFLLL